eukprot:GILJ01005519.1.p2 GENE.GILJ01005519.1~~GILJ01005519.1.p2  ORF type:complete len:198 (-),score=28.77 GILJ01005519.1:118-711(-)
MKCVLSSDGYCKAVLHACRWPDKEVIGLLLGSIDKNQIVIRDAIPLFHSQTLSMMLEAALLQVEKYCESVESVRIVGCYFANSNLSDDRVNVVATRLAERIASHYQNACVLAIDNKSIGDEEVSLPAKAYLWDPHQSMLKSTSDVQLAEGTKAALSSYMDSAVYTAICDFDDHFDDLSKDWTNTGIFLTNTGNKNLL